MGNNQEIIYVKQISGIIDISRTYKPGYLKVLEASTTEQDLTHHNDLVLESKRLEQEKIKKYMSAKTDAWDFSKLPISEYNNALKYFDVNDVDMMVRLHNKYELSTNNYCCNPGQDLRSWYRHAIQNKLIYATD